MSAPDLTSDNATELDLAMMERALALAAAARHLVEIFLFDCLERLGAGQYFVEPSLADELRRGIIFGIADMPLADVDHLEQHHHATGQNRRGHDHFQ